MDAPQRRKDAEVSAEKTVGERASELRSDGQAGRPVLLQFEEVGGRERAIRHAGGEDGAFEVVAAINAGAD